MKYRVMPMFYVGLRHDVDNNWVIKFGALKKVLEIEERCSIRSTFFIRTDVLKDDKDWNVILEAQDKGWEIGLHLINTTNSSIFLPPMSELETLRRRGIKVYGVTPCGKTIGWTAPHLNWRVMDELGLTYMEGYGEKPKSNKTFIFDTHLSLDTYYVRMYGSTKGYEIFKNDLYERIKRRKYATVLTHPEYFLKSVGIWTDNLHVARIFRLLYSILRIRTIDKVYEKFLLEHARKLIFLRYIDLYKELKKL